jgi:hypothetical protein
MSRLFLDLAEAECQLASLALVSGRAELVVRSLERAAHYLALRWQEGAVEDARILPMWTGKSR